MHLAAGNAFSPTISHNSMGRSWKIVNIVAVEHRTPLELECGSGGFG